MAYDQTTRSYKMTDDGGSYSWIWQDTDPYQWAIEPDSEIYDWVDMLIDQAVEEEINNLERSADTLTFPRYGYSTTHKFEDLDSYLNWKRDEITGDLRNERDTVFKQIKAWIARELNLQPKDQITEAIDENSAVVKLWWRGKTLIVADKTEEMYTEDGDQIDAYYELSFHEGMMPAYGHEQYPTIEALFEAMEEYAPLTDWEISQPE